MLGGFQARLNAFAMWLALMLVFVSDRGVDCRGEFHR